MPVMKVEEVIPEFGVVLGFGEGDCLGDVAQTVDDESEGAFGLPSLGVKVD